MILSQVSNNESSSPSTTEQLPPELTSLRPGDQLSTTAAARYDFTQIMPQENLISLNDVADGIPLFIVHPIEGAYYGKLNACEVRVKPQKIQNPSFSAYNLHVN